MAEPTLRTELSALRSVRRTSLVKSTVLCAQTALEDAKHALDNQTWTVTTAKQLLTELSISSFMALPSVTRAVLQANTKI